MKVMSSKNVIKIITDLSKFEERVDEIVGTTSYDQVKHAVAELKNTLTAYSDDVVALCAPQIGLNLRLFAVKTANKQIKVFLNPMVISAEGLHLSREINASLKGKEYIIPRKDKIHLAYQEIDGRANSETYTGVYAEVIQQMVEMLDGILLCDYGLEIDEDFDKATEKQRQAIIAMYLNHLKNNYAELKSEIDNTPELKVINENIDFMTRLLSGEIKPVDDKGNIVDTFKPKTDEVDK